MLGQKILLIYAVWIYFCSGEFQVWVWVVSNNIKYVLSDDGLGVDVPSAIMTVLDSLILGNIFKCR